MSALNQQLDDPHFPQITYRRGAVGIPTPVVRGTGIRVQSIAIAHTQWEMSAAEIAAEYGLAARVIEEAIAFYNAHRAEIETQMAYEERIAGELQNG